MKMKLSLAMVAVGVLAFMASHVNASLIGHWTFDEGSGTTAVDSASGHDGVILGGAAYAPGPLGSALHFDGVDAHVVVPYHSTISLANTPYTFALWINREIKTGNQRIINTDNGNDFQGGYSIWYSGSSSNRFRTTHMNNSGADEGFYLTAGQSTLPAGWNHLAVVFNGSDLKYYLNGAQITTKAVLNGPIVDRGLDLWFGGMPVYGQYFKGTLDDIRIYDNALTDADVVSLAVPEPVSMSYAGLFAIVAIFQTRRWTRQVSLPVFHIGPSSVRHTRSIARENVKAVPVNSVSILTFVAQRLNKATSIEGCGQHEQWPHSHLSKCLLSPVSTDLPSEI